jgi:hypothetical protein
METIFIHELKLFLLPGLSSPDFTIGGLRCRPFSLAVVAGLRYEVGDETNRTRAVVADIVRPDSRVRAN